MSATNALEIGTDRLNARVYAGLSVASELASWLIGPKLVTVNLFSAWKIYRRLGRLSRELDEIFTEYERPVPFLSVVPGELIRVGRDILLQLYGDCKRLESPLGDIPLHGLISKRLCRLQVQSERLLDLADWFDAMANPDETSAKFEVALSDLANGEVVPWSAVS